MNTFFTPTEAPVCHLELLPNTATAVLVSAGNWTRGSGANVKHYPFAVHISTWASGPNMDCVTGTSLDDFCDNVCQNCRYYDSIVDLDMDDYEVEYQGEYVTISGDVRATSPCPAYDNGIGDVSWPCMADNEGPDSETLGELETTYMRYTHVMQLETPAWYTLSMQAIQQASDIYEDPEGSAYQCLIVGDEHRAINTFDGSNEICWGENTEGFDLANAAVIYSGSDANEDLLSFEGHQEGTYQCNEDDLEDILPNSHLLRSCTNNKAVVVAHAAGTPNAYILFASSGATVDSYTASIPVYEYKSVQIMPDVVATVWVSDELPTGIRMMFMFDPTVTQGAEIGFNCQFLGQVPSNFSLEPVEQNTVDVSPEKQLVATK